MSKLVILVRFQAIATTTLISIFTVFAIPALSQETEGEGQSTATEVVESSVVADEGAEEAEPLEALTADNPEIPSDQLKVLLKPLTQEQLQAEADAWFLLLQQKAQEISDLEYAIKVQEEEIGGDVDTQKEEQVVTATRLKTEQTNLASRLNTVLEDLEAKGGDPKTYQQYVSAVSGLEFDITNTEGLGLRFTTWLQSEEGGIKLGLNLLKFFGILIVTVIVAPRLGKVTDHALARVSNISTLFRGFVVMVVNRSVLVVGALLAIASLGVNLGPILAVVGGASFVLAFALQSNLGNFASGLMLLINKPFDVGDEVKVAGYWAYVDSISLANTKLKAFNGSMITLPNNTVWGGDIINYTHGEIRKQMIPINIKFEQDMNQVYQMWMDITSSHPKVLKDPAPGWFPYNSSYEYYISVSLSAWTTKDDYWEVYVDLIKELQKRIEELNIQLAAPQQEIKLAQYPKKTLTQSSVETITPSENHQ